MHKSTPQNFDWYKYCALIPAYNAEKSLPELVSRIQNLHPDLDILIVDDGSRQRVDSYLSNKPKIDILRHKTNQGKGKALITGLKAAQGRNKKYCICLDADLQHDPVQIGNFLNKKIETNCDIILGVRDIYDSMPFHRILSNTITSFLISLKTGVRVHDSQCGYRLLTLEQLDLNEFKYTGFQFESEFLVKTLSQGYSLSEIPIETIYNHTSSNIENIGDTFRFIKLYFESYFWN